MSINSLASAVHKPEGAQPVPTLNPAADKPGPSVSTREKSAWIGERMKALDKVDRFDGMDAFLEMDGDREQAVVDYFAALLGSGESGNIATGLQAVKAYLWQSMLNPTTIPSEAALQFGGLWLKRPLQDVVNFGKGVEDAVITMVVRNKSTEISLNPRK